MHWFLSHPNMTPDQLGYLPSFLSQDDPAPARDQINKNYRFGGWRPQDGFTLDRRLFLLYPGDPALQPLAATFLRKEIIMLYPADYVAIIQPDRRFEVCRVD